MQVPLSSLSTTRSMNVQLVAGYQLALQGIDLSHRFAWVERNNRSDWCAFAIQFEVVQLMMPNLNVQQLIDGSITVIPSSSDTFNSARCSFYIC